MCFRPTMVESSQTCPECGEEQESMNLVCTKCGCKLEPQMKPTAPGAPGFPAPGAPGAPAAPGARTSQAPAAPGVPSAPSSTDA